MTDQPRATTDALPVVAARGVHKHFGEHHVLRGIDLEVRSHETVMLIGRSGSGKTTFLRCLDFLEEPTLGTIRIGDVTIEADPLRARARGRREQVRRLRTQAGFVFQDFNLFPHLTVLENCIEAPVRVKGVRRAEAVAAAEAYLEKVQLSAKRDEYPARLSGGQKQRAAIARALCMDPKVLLFDEPTSALDPELVGEVLRTMEALAHEGRTMIVVSREMAFAREAADRVVFLHDGRILEEGPPDEVLEHPREEATVRFLRRFTGR